MASRGSITMRDNSRQIIQTSFDGVAITDYTTEKALWDALVTAIEGITIGEVAVNWYGEYVTNNAAPASPIAQVATQWRVQYVDQVSLKSFAGIRIGTADLAQLPVGQDRLDLTTGVGLAFKDAFEAFYLHEGNSTVVVSSVFFVQ